MQQSVIHHQFIRIVVIITNMSQQQKTESIGSKSKNYRGEAMKLLSDLLSINSNTINSSVKTTLDNSKSKKQTKTSKSQGLIKKDLGSSGAYDCRLKMRQLKYTEQEEHKHLEDSSIIDQKQGLNISNSGFPHFPPVDKKNTYKNATLLRLSNEEIITQQAQSKRNFVYEHQSFREPIPNQTNNKFFDLLFLKKIQLSDTLSTNSSDSRTKYLMSNLNIQHFQIGNKLGAGKFGIVYAAKHKKLGFICALKKISKEGVEAKALVQLIRQIKIQSFLEHPNIVKLYNFFSDDKFIYLLMEYCASGDMYAFLKRRKRVQEICVQSMIRQVCKAIEYMHQNNIIHRDLKPQNILLNNGMVKICDFGWSIGSTVNRQTFCGTPLYVSPELLKRNNYNNKIDVWSIGILTHELLFGRVPFDIFTEGDLIKIVEDDIYFSKKQNISQQAKSFMVNCLQKDPRDRSTVTELLDHPFLKIDKPTSQELF